MSDIKSKFFYNFFAYGRDFWHIEWYYGDFACNFLYGRREYRRGVFIGSGARALLRKRTLFACRYCFLASVLLFKFALPRARSQIRRIRRGDFCTLPTRRAFRKSLAVRCGVRACGGHACGIGRASAQPLAAYLRARTSVCIAVFTAGDRRHHRAQYRACACAPCDRFCLYGGGHQSYISARTPSARGYRRGNRVRRHERHSRRARPHGSGCEDEAPCLARAILCGNRLYLCRVYSRRDLSGGGGRHQCADALSLRNARERCLLHCLRACHSHVACLGALSAPWGSRLFSGQKEIRRKGTCRACGVCAFPLRTSGDRAVFLSRGGCCGTGVFSCLHF